MMRTLRLHALMQRSLTAMLHPRQAFQNIEDEVRVPYLIVVPFMVGWGAFYAILHFRFMNGDWLWQDPLGIGRCRFLVFVVGSPTVWMLGSLGLWHFARWMGKPMSLAEADKESLKLWLVWAVMPVVDLVHLAGLPKYTLQLPGPWPVVFITHASWLVAFPMIVWQLSGFLRSRWHSSRGHLWVPAAMAVGILVVARVIFEPLPQMLCRLWQWLIPSQFPGDWWMILVLSGLILSIGSSLRAAICSKSRWFVVAQGLGGLALLATIAPYLVYQ